MPTVISADGTAIGYERTGDGPPLVLVDGAMCHRAAGPMRPLAALLRDRFTVCAYDRRGRGESGDTQPYAVAREIEDLRAVIAEVGGEAFVYGISSGAALALAAAAEPETGISKVACYEPPFVADDGADDMHAKEYTQRLATLLGEGRGGDAVALFMTRVGLPEQAVAGMRAQPGWAGLEAIAPTLAYDDVVLGGGRVPHELTAQVTVPALVLCGSASPESLRRAARATAQALPAADFGTLAGQTHDVAPEALAPPLTAFFAPNPPTA
jgi:pimeloyl-ACP methyl ester carboxylesterase